MGLEENLENLADVLVWGVTKARKKKIKKGEIFLIRFEIGAVKLAECIYRRLLHLGLNPVLRFMSTAKMEKDFYMLSNPKQISFIPPGEEELYRVLAGGIYINAPESLTHLQGVDPKKINRFVVSRKKLRDILEKRESQGLFGWTLTVYPTEELASKAGTDLETYFRQMEEACFLTERDPVSQWEEVYRHIREIRRWLNSLDIKLLEVESSSFSIKIPFGEHRMWVGISGHNIPSFELFFSPDFRGVQGTYFSDLPSFRNGNYVEGVRLVFERGKVAEATAEKGEEFLKEQIKMDDGASRVGEFSLTDRRFSRINRFMANTLYDENYGGRFGNCHLALGASYLDTCTLDTSNFDKEQKIKLGFNDSALHWDLVNTENKTVTAILGNGKKRLIYEEGVFLY